MGNSLEDDANKLKSPSPRRVLEMFKFGKKTKKEPAAEPDIEHPFEQKSDHFSLLEQADAQQSSLKPVAKEDAATAHRKRHGFILAELIQTEKDYVEDLEMIVELFLVPLRANKLVNKEEADGVFGNLPHLIPLNRHLLDKIKVDCLLSRSFCFCFFFFLTAHLHRSNLCFLQKSKMLAACSKRFFFPTVSKSMQSLLLSLN